MSNEPIIYFKAATAKTDDGFQMCVCGKSIIDNEQYVVTTDNLHVDEIPSQCQDAKPFAELVATLLNAHFNSTL